jgi:1-pyrroline-5-carboxylate dehydrogenase
VSAAESTKVTYTTSAADMDAIHAAFDRALEKVRAECGKRYPIHVAGREIQTEADPIVDTSPIDTELVLGEFTAAGREHVEEAIESAYRARRGWEKLGWEKRVEIMHRVAELIREQKYELAACMSLEVGKNRLESLGDAEEAADLIDYYAWQMENAAS